MDLLTQVILLLICLLLSNVVSHYLPSIPVALIQIALGIGLALAVSHVSFEIETEWFLLLFVAPLLYNDGRHFPRDELWNMKGAILGNAILLVLITTIGGGYAIHWLIPSIPLAAAFALAAILSPTDPVAVNGIAKRIRIPEKVLHLVRGESLINDATGLVSFNYAVAAVVTGYFSLHKALFDFAYMFVIGGLLGIVLGILSTGIRFVLRKQGIQDAAFHTLLQLLTPFVIFIVTEEWLHASGVVAVVVAGMIHALVKERTETLVAEEQVLTENAWSILSFILNGLVFLLLGLNIPSTIRETVANPNMSNTLVVGYAFTIGLVILGIRFIWTHLFAWYEYRTGRTEKPAKPKLVTTLVTSLTGVRGAVTMAGVLSIPYVIRDGGPFPERSLILFLAAGVILFTILAATLLLPFVSRETGGTEGEGAKLDMSEAKQKMLLSAIRTLRKQITEENEAAAYELIDEYKQMFQQIMPEQAGRYHEQITQVHLAALQAEREVIEAASREGQLDSHLFDAFEQILDSREKRLAGSVRLGMTYVIRSLFRKVRRTSKPGSAGRQVKIALLQQGMDIQLKAMESAIHAIEAYAKEMNTPEIADGVKSDYRRMISRLRSKLKQTDPLDLAEKQEQKEELRLKVMDIERSEIRMMFEAGTISREQAKELRRFLNYIENVTLYEYAE
ncbi:Na+/H+ antiporter [Paenibacillus protaetiae]|uniref:Na+/H+ antiporter n=1 Tax=Paenibacillus protaetiae TaxID=2509456 RepID=A0A4P6ERS7_9BACL|nr:Na+/H+ antiporter [Paenibacillus protaetiae]QAY65770.1 Na+/H+ antiporter [Paenibacillus protaetiae]